MPDPTNDLTPMPAAGRPVDSSAMPAEQILTTDSRPAIARERVNPKWLRYYDVLIRMRDDLIDSRAAHDRDAREITPKAVMRNLASMGTEAFHQERLLSLRSFEQTQLQEIEHALARIARGTYGVCEVTGKPIPEERLDGMPWTRCSLEGQQQAEAESDTSSPVIGQDPGARPTEGSVTSFS